MKRRGIPRVVIRLEHTATPQYIRGWSDVDNAPKLTTRADNARPFPKRSDAQKFVDRYKLVGVAFEEVIH